MLTALRSATRIVFPMLLGSFWAVAGFATASVLAPRAAVAYGCNQEECDLVFDPARGKAWRECVDNPDDKNPTRCEKEGSSCTTYAC